MTWVRSRTRHGAVLALLALAIQLVLSFGHVHADALVQGSLQVAAVKQVGATSPSGPGTDRDNPAADACAICATVAMAGAALAAAPPALALPVAFVIAHAGVPYEADLAQAPHAAFQSRAPPHS